MTAAILLAAALAAHGAEMPDSRWVGDTEVDVRRVAISLGFAGQLVFVHGTTPADLEGMVAIVEAPPQDDCRIMEKGRLGPIWLGLRQYRIGALPSFYLVLAHDPGRNRLHDRAPGLDLGDLNRQLEARGVAPVGAAALASRALVQPIGGLGRGADPAALLDSLWTMQADRGLFGIDLDAIRVSRDGMYSYWLMLPEVAPEGRYTITTHYLRRSGLVTEHSGLLVRRTGAVAVITRLASRHSALYGITTVLLAVVIGWLSGALDRGRNGL